LFTALAFDQRGLGKPRIVDGDSDGTLTVDIGAFELENEGFGPPTNKEQCENGGWRRFTLPRKFRNQGDCIQFVNTSK
jgi:hypothetical protein